MSLLVLAAIAIALGAHQDAGKMMAHAHSIEMLSKDMTMNMGSMDAMPTTNASAASTTVWRCPICRMSTMMNGYNNHHYVELAHGQRVFTCGMKPRKLGDYAFNVTDTIYLGANMAEFIVLPSDTANYNCSTKCEQCEQGEVVQDPISGATISASNFTVVCLKNGQKIYFASNETRTKYLDQVNKAPRYMVDHMTCANEVCSNSTAITTLSTAAAKFSAEESTKPTDKPADKQSAAPRVVLHAAVQVVTWLALAAAAMPLVSL